MKSRKTEERKKSVYKNAQNLSMKTREQEATQSSEH